MRVEKEKAKCEVRCCVVGGKAAQFADEPFYMF